MEARIEECRAAALRLLERAAGPHGFVASPSFAHYDSIWTRDAGITSLGAAASGDVGLIDGIRRTLVTLSGCQTDLGMVANTYWPEAQYWDWGESGSVDAQAWYVIMAGVYYKATGDVGFIRTLLPSLLACFTWMRYQDRTGFGLVSSGEANDWMDSSLNRSGIVLHNNILYFQACRALEEICERLGAARLAVSSAFIKQRINELLWPETNFDYSNLLSHVGYAVPPRFPHPASLTGFQGAAQDRSFYLSHVTFGTFADACDVLANCLAVVSGVAETDRAAKIVSYLVSASAATPFPSKTWTAPVVDEDPWDLLKAAAERTQDPRWRNPPGRYHNGGVWPFIGGFHVAALAELGATGDAAALLGSLAEANRLRAGGGEWGFHEWIDARTGEPGGAPDQAWSAGAYLMAYHAIEQAIAQSRRHG